MKPSPLKGKVRYRIEKFDGGAGKALLVPSASRDEIRAAVEWLRQLSCECNIKTESFGLKCSSCTNIDKAFEDVMEK